MMGGTSGRYYTGGGYPPIGTFALYANRTVWTTEQIVQHPIYFTGAVRSGKDLFIQLERGETVEDAKLVLYHHWRGLKPTMYADYYREKFTFLDPEPTKMERLRDRVLRWLDEVV